jgi:hypothetical protein
VTGRQREGPSAVLARLLPTAKDLDGRGGGGEAAGEEGLEKEGQEEVQEALEKGIMSRGRSQGGLWKWSEEGAAFASGSCFSPGRSLPLLCRLDADQVGEHQGRQLHGCETEAPDPCHQQGRQGSSAPLGLGGAADRGRGMVRGGRSSG